MSHGPILAGHADLSCTDCHVSAPGTLRQQVQAVVAKDPSADFGFRAVNSKICLACHKRANERHPIHRFKEPRFIEAVAKIDARNCLSCHSNHDGNRLKISDLTYCSACHENLKLKKDPLDRPHETLIAMNDWDSCLGCHDFHGNHKRSAQVLYKDRFSSSSVIDYARQGPDPYAPKKTFQAETQR